MATLVNEKIKYTASQSGETYLYISIGQEFVAPFQSQIICTMRVQSTSVGMNIPIEGTFKYGGVQAHIKTSVSETTLSEVIATVEHDQETGLAETKTLYLSLTRFGSLAGLSRTWNLVLEWNGARTPCSRVENLITNMTVLSPGNTPSLTWSRPEGGHLNPLNNYYIYYSFEETADAPSDLLALEGWEKLSTTRYKTTYSLTQIKDTMIESHRGKFLQIAIEPISTENVGRTTPTFAQPIYVNTKPVFRVNPYTPFPPYDEQQGRITIDFTSAPGEAGSLDSSLGQTITMLYSWDEESWEVCPDNKFTTTDRSKIKKNVYFKAYDGYEYSDSTAVRINKLAEGRIDLIVDGHPFTGMSFDITPANGNMSTNNSYEIIVSCDGTIIYESSRTIGGNEWFVETIDDVRVLLANQHGGYFPGPWEESRTLSCVARISRYDGYQTCSVDHSFTFTMPRITFTDSEYKSDLRKYDKKIYVYVDGESMEEYFTLAEVEGTSEGPSLTTPGSLFGPFYPKGAKCEEIWFNHSNSPGFKVAVPAFSRVEPFNLSVLQPTGKICPFTDYTFTVYVEGAGASATDMAVSRDGKPPALQLRYGDKITKANSVTESSGADRYEYHFTLPQLHRTILTIDDIKQGSIDVWASLTNALFMQSITKITLNFTLDNSTKQFGDTPIIIGSAGINDTNTVDFSEWEFLTEGCDVCAKIKALTFGERLQCRTTSRIGSHVDTFVPPLSTAGLETQSSTNPNDGEEDIWYFYSGDSATLYPYKPNRCDFEIELFTIPDLRKTDHLQITLEIFDGIATQTLDTESVEVKHFVPPSGHLEEAYFEGGKLVVKYAVDSPGHDMTTLADVKLSGVNRKSMSNPNVESGNWSAASESNKTAIINVTSQDLFKGVDGVVEYVYICPLLTSSFGPKRNGSTNLFSKIVRKTGQAKSFMVLYNTVPTVAYRKNQIGINSTSPENKEDAVAVVNAYNDYKKIYFTSSEHTAILDLLTGKLDNIIIDCGEW